MVAKKWVLRSAAGTLDQALPAALNVGSNSLRAHVRRTDARARGWYGLAGCAFEGCAERGELYGRGPLAVARSELAEELRVELDDAAVRSGQRRESRDGRLCLCVRERGERDESRSELGESHRGRGERKGACLESVGLSLSLAHERVSVKVTAVE